MSQLNTELLKRIINTGLNQNIEDFNSFIETGTNAGDSVISVEKDFAKVHTIELSEKYFELFEKRKQLLGKDNIISHLGDSTTVLPKILSILNENDNCIFWLDGHWSSCDTAKGDKDCPLNEECDSIDRTYKANSAIILIDDYRLFNTKLNEDWSEITEENLRNKFNNFVILNQLVLNDILALHIQRKTVSTNE